MDTHQLKITPTGHENHGVHVCQKCGWPFPNPHPSSKHRRAHKRICGTIEGYKLTGAEDHTHSTGSDDQDHPSDEDCKTPSPKMEKQSISGSGGVGERSNRSEDEVFSDAVAEFSDSGFSTGMEEPLEDVKALDKDVQGSTEPLSIPPENREVGSPEVIENATSTIIPFQDTKTEETLSAGTKDVLNVFIGDNGKKYLTTGLGRDTDMNAKKDEVDEFLMDVEEAQSTTVSKTSELSDSQELDKQSPHSVPAGFIESMQCEIVEGKMFVHGHPPQSESVEHVEASVNAVQVKADLIQDIDAGTDGDLIEIHDTNREVKEHVLLVANDFPIVDHADILRSNFKDHKTLKSDSPKILGSADVTRPLEDDNKVMITKSKPDETSTDFEHTEASVSTVQIETDPTRDMDSGNLFEICDTNKDTKETMHVLSVASDFPIVEHADIMLKDFKDHRTFKSSFSPNLGSPDVIRPLEGDNIGMVIKENPLSLHSTKTVGFHSSSAERNDAEDAYNLKQDGEENMLTTGPDKRVADTSKFCVTSGEVLESNGLEAPPSPSRSVEENIQTNFSLQGAHSGASHMVSSLFDEVKHTTGLRDGDSINRHETAQVEEFVTEGKSSEGVTKQDLSAKEHTNFVYEDDYQKTKLTGGTDRAEHGKATIELSDEAWSEKCAGAAADNNCTTTLITKLEPGREFSDSKYSAPIPEKTPSDINTSVSSNMTHPGLKYFPGNYSQEVEIEPNINTESKVVAECAGKGVMGSKLSQNADVEVSEDNLQEPSMKELGSSPIHSEISHGSSQDVKIGHSSDGGKGQFGDRYEPMQESDGKLTKQPGGTSAVDVSVDSSSQTDSVEGNWGSVSVLSAQSDAPVSSGTEVLTKTDPEETGKSENSNLHAKTASEIQDSDKASVFEPPSFMTLIEPRAGVDQKAVVSEIETVQSTQQPNSEALQAGWFPSLTNVVNESPGRKKNEEIIAKVTNWSSGKHHSTPLKNLLGEAKVESKPNLPSPKETETIIQKDETTVKDVLGSEAPVDQVVKRETAEEWNSPARYPVEIKKEKRKVKGKPSWVPFVCCSSVN